MNEIMVKEFENTKVDIIELNGEPMFEVYSTGMALGYSKSDIKNGKEYLRIRKDRVDTVIKNAEIRPFAHSGLTYFTEEMLYDFMLEARTEKVKPFRKWITNEVLPIIRKTGGYIVEDREEEFINTYFPSFTDDVKIAMVQDLRTQNKTLKEQTKVLNQENDLLSEKALKWANRNFINASVRQYAGYACNGNFGEAWIDFKKELLYKHGINLNSRITKYLNETGKKTKPKTLEMLHDSEVPSAVSTIVAMCRDRDVDISDIINKSGDAIEY